MSNWSFKTNKWHERWRFSTVVKNTTCLRYSYPISEWLGSNPGSTPDPSCLISTSWEQLMMAHIPRSLACTWEIQMNSCLRLFRTFWKWIATENHSLPFKTKQIQKPIWLAFEHDKNRTGEGIAAQHGKLLWVIHIPCMNASSNNGSSVAIKLPANASWEATDNGPSAWALATYEGDLDGVPGTWL